MPGRHRGGGRAGSAGWPEHRMHLLVRDNRKKKRRKVVGSGVVQADTSGLW